jgi:trk system potassium uptake protein TrkH
LTIGFLIIIGGLGFFVWSDIKDYKLKFKKYSLHSKLVLTTTAGLLIGGTFFFLILEYNKPTYEGLSFFSKVLNSFFQAVTPRTAGFNSVDIGIMTEASLLVTVFLMLVGGSSGSTAGGIKTTTFAVLILNILSVSRRRDSLQVFRRRIDESTLRSSVTIVSVYVFLLLTSTLIISAIENLPVIDTLFESASAIATVGLTTGITDKIGSISKIILTFLMYFGRVGCLTLIYAITISAGPQYSKLPAEKIAVG